MAYFGQFYLDEEKDIIVDLDMDQGELSYTLKTPNHHTGNLITNLAGLCDLPLSEDENGLKVIRGKVPCYIDAQNREIYIFRLGGTKTANIFSDGTIEMKASIPAVSKTLMSQTKDYRLDIQRTVIKSYIPREYKFRTDLHTHMNANLRPDILIALGIYHQIRYPLYYVRKLGLRLSASQAEELARQRELTARQFADSGLTGKYLERKVDDHTFINFAALILQNLDNAAYNIPRIRTSLAILKDGQAVFTNLEKVYLYRYVFTKGQPHEQPVELRDIGQIPDRDIAAAVKQMQADHAGIYADNTLFQDKLLWTARGYRRQGIDYAEISDTTLVKRHQAVEMLRQVHAVMPKIERETGVLLRFLAAIRRIPLTIVRDNITAADYLEENIRVLRGIARDPYVAGADIVGEEINSILELRPVIRELVKIAVDDNTFVIRIHAGENDSMKDNVADSIRCVREALAPGQPMPKVRIGHGLYTASLRSVKGRQLISDLKESGAVLEFQITSNVRLNNLNNLKSHPLKQYLRAGIRCVQGTDGGALYGTASMDEQLALEKLLALSREDLLKMRQTEEEILGESRQAMARKQEAFAELSGTLALEEILAAEPAVNETRKKPAGGPVHLEAARELAGQVQDMPWNRFPVVVAGGSFNNKGRHTRMSAAGKAAVDALLRLDPGEVFFIIGHTLSGYEKYLLEHNDNRGFRIFAIVPAELQPEEVRRLKQAGVEVRIAIEASPMGLYKSFNYEIFERRPFVLAALDGNSAGANLMQEARNSKGHGRIYVNPGCAPLRIKAASLRGYVTLLEDPEQMAADIRQIVSDPASMGHMKGQENRKSMQ